MKYLDLFAGIGGFAFGISDAFPNSECIGFSEIDETAISIYLKHFPNHPNLGDITKITAEELPDFDLCVAGFPCPDFSMSGKRKGTEYSRGKLFWEVLRIVKAKKPRYILLENVPGLLSSQTVKGIYDFDVMMEDLSSVGYAIDFTVLNSKYFGVAQNRARVYVLAINLDYLSKECVI